MPYYHCSPAGGLKTLQPGRPEHFEKPSLVYMTTSLPMALMYGVRNFEYTYGYTRDGKIYYEEYFPNALRELYAGRRASLYLCAPEDTDATAIPNEAVSPLPVAILEERPIPDVYEALLEQERLGNLMIRRYHELSARSLAWIQDAEAEEIRQNRLLTTPGARADYMRLHYPESWELVRRELEAAAR